MRHRKSSPKKHKTRSRSAKFAERQGRRKNGQRHPEERAAKSGGHRYVGKVQKNPRGFAFIIPQTPGVPDAYVGRHEARVLLHGDRVEYTLVRDRGRYSAQIKKVLEHASSRVVGQVRPVGRDLALVTAQGDIHRIKRESKLSPGEWIIGEIKESPTSRHPGTVVVEEHLGYELSPKHDIEIAIAQFGLPNEFGPKVCEEGFQARSRAHAAITNLGTRKDQRAKPYVTIDGEDAKDFDDAILVERGPGGKGFILYVAIADVSYFVVERSAIDHEARKRSTSVYFPGAVIPMLPEILSNDLCSLRPQEDKLAFTAEIHLDERGVVQKSHFYESLIKTAARLTYTQVHAFFQGDKATRDELKALAVPLETARVLFERMLEQRRQRGVLDFELPESKIEVDAQGKPLRVKRADRYESHRLIEEFMVGANSVVARALRERNEPALHRVHESPAPEKLDDLNQLLNRLGISRRMKDLSPQSFSELLEATRNLPEAPTLHKSILRTQKQARYEVEPKGHFGLALRDYTHFTSPIRRYPDLVVHRALKKLISKGKQADKDNEGIASFQQLGEETSEKERRAMEAERFVLKRKQCWYMQGHVGEVFDGVVSGVLESGLFVELPELAIDGFLPVEDMDGYWEYDERRLCLRRRPGGQVLTLGDPLRIEVVSVSMDDNEITFGLPE